MGAQTVKMEDRWLWWRVWWRFWTGNHLDGRKRSNATWTLKSTDTSGRINWWNRQPRFKRMAIRHAVTWPVLVDGALMFYIPWAGWLMLGLGMLYLGARAFLTIRSRLFMPVRANGKHAGWIAKPKTMRRIESLPPEVRKLFGGNDG
jgi:hypothetical protein